MLPAGSTTVGKCEGAPSRGRAHSLAELVDWLPGTIRLAAVSIAPEVAVRIIAKTAESFSGHEERGGNL